MSRIKHEIPIEEILDNAEGKTIYYGANTCWWTDNPDHLRQNNAGLPTDPRGGVLFQTEEGDAIKFLKQAKENASHYGKHGLRAFMLAYHGCVVTDGGQPNCFRTWDNYNTLIDLWGD